MTNNTILLMLSCCAMFQISSKILNKWEVEHHEDTILGRQFNKGNLLFTRVKRTMTVCIFILQSTNKLHLG